MPRSEGHIRRIPLTAGACDNLICLLAKLGIDPSEFGVQGEDKAVTFFAGAPSQIDAMGLARFDARKSGDARFCGVARPRDSV